MKGRLAESTASIAPLPRSGRSRLVFAGSVLVAGALLALSLRGVVPSEIVVTLQRTQPAPLGVSALALTGAYFARGLRWRMQIGRVVPLSSFMAFWATMTGFLTNNILPLRAGEVVRPVITSRMTGIGVSYAFACVLVEHVVDIAALVIMSFTASVAHVEMPVWLHSSAMTFALLGCVGMLLLFVLVWIDRPLVAMLDRIPITRKFSGRLQPIIRQFGLGLRALGRPRDTLAYVGVTAIVWLLDIFMGVVVAWALRMPLVWSQVALLLVALSLASAAPSTPANIGIWQVVAVALLGPFGVTHAAAIAYILVFQLVTFGVETLWGLIGLIAITRANPTISWKSIRILP